VSRPAAVVFDCDGVLGALDHPATPHDIAACIGLGFEPTRASLAELAPLPSAEELWPLLLAALRRSFEAGLSVFEDARTTLYEVRDAGMPAAVVSASPRQRLDLTLEVAGLWFDVSVSGDEVVNSKPAPDGYLAAARLLGVEPTACIAVEDSAPGVQAALAAGMKVVAVNRSGTPEGHAALMAAGGFVVEPLSSAALGL
jgi:HAD superfamily hydrolase (TIGR01509 family)